MANIIELLQNILSARYGKDVRQSIHDAIKTCYDDGKAGVIDYEARAELPFKADLENGQVKLSQIPQVALDNLVKVQTDADRFALTTAEVQTGDTVKVIETDLMYLVVDDTKLDSEDGYTGYSASVDWETISGRPEGVVGAQSVAPPVQITDPAPLYRADVVNDLNSTDTDKPLSAAMGKELNDKNKVVFNNPTSSDKEYTITEDGNYLIMMKRQSNSGDDSMNIAVSVNDTEVSCMVARGGAFTAIVTSLVANDIVSFKTKSTVAKDTNIRFNQNLIMKL